MTLGTKVRFLVVGVLSGVFVLGSGCGGPVRTVLQLAWMHQPQFIAQDDGIHLAVLMQPGPLVMPTAELAKDQLHHPVVPHLDSEKPLDELFHYDLQHPDGRPYLEYLEQQPGWWAWGKNRLPPPWSVCSLYRNEKFVWILSDGERSTSIRLDSIEHEGESSRQIRIDFRFALERGEQDDWIKCSAWTGSPMRVSWSDG